MNYIAQTTISDGTRDYQPGDSLTLADVHATPLLALGYIVVAETAAGGSPSSPPASLTNLNTASLADLVALPQIGQAIARRLIKNRPLGSLDDARVIGGLSPESWAIVAPLVEV